MIGLQPAPGYPPSEEGEEALRRFRRFLENRIAPLLAEFRRCHPGQTGRLEADGRIGAPLLELKRKVQQLSAEDGFYCSHLAREDGGLGLSLVDSFYLQEEAFRHGLDGAQWSLAWTDGPSHLVRYWSNEARERHLADFVSGRSAVAFALTEPGVGSDFPALATSVRRDGSGWLLSGRKNLITAAPFAELAQVFARLEGAPRGRLTAFLVPLDAPGVERGKVQQTIMGDGQTGSIAFHDVRLEPSALIGREGDGQRLAFLWINWTRTRRGGMCSGLAYHCLERSLTHSGGREAFGGSIGRIGAVAAMLADIYMDWEAMRALSLGILARLDAASVLQARVSPEDRALVSALKAWNDAALYRVADRAIQVHGGMGLLVETGLEKIFRVARNLRIPAGTEEVQRAVIADALLVAGVPGGATDAADRSVN